MATKINGRHASVNEMPMVSFVWKPLRRNFPAILNAKRQDIYKCGRISSTSVEVLRCQVTFTRSSGSFPFFAVQAEPPDMPRAVHECL